MHLKKIHIKNFKSYSDQVIELNRLSVIIGANASGKSNIIEAFRFINNIFIYGVEDAISLSGGVEYLYNANIGRGEPVSFMFDISTDNTIDDNFVGSVLTNIYCEFEIRINKRGSGFAITKDNVILTYDMIVSENLDKVHHVISSFTRTSNGRMSSTCQCDSYDLSEEEKDNIFFKSITDFMNQERDNKELIANKLSFILILKLHLNNIIKIYDFDSKLLKKSTEISTTNLLEENGSNLALVLQRILNNKRMAKDLLHLVSDCLPFVESASVKVNSDKSVFYLLREKYSDRVFRSNFISDGTANIIAIITALYFQPNSGIIVLEEPERNLHPKLMSKIIEMAEECSLKRQIIITTHTPEIVKCANKDSLFFVKRGQTGFSKIVKPSDSDAVKVFLDNEIDISDLFVQDLLEV